MQRFDVYDITCGWTTRWCHSNKYIIKLRLLLLLLLLWVMRGSINLLCLNLGSWTCLLNTAPSPWMLSLVKLLKKQLQHTSIIYSPLTLTPCLFLHIHFVCFFYNIPLIWVVKLTAISLSCSSWGNWVAQMCMCPEGVEHFPSVFTPWKRLRSCGSVGSVNDLCDCLTSTFFYCFNHRSLHRLKSSQKTVIKIWTISLHLIKEGIFWLFKPETKEIIRMITAVDREPSHNYVWNWSEIKLHQVVFH